MKILIAILSLCAIGFIGIAHGQVTSENPDGSYHYDSQTAEPLAEIHPVTSLSKISTEPDGYLYFYDFDMDTHNQTITIQSVDFVINDTDTTLYNQGMSGVGVEGQNDVIPLTSLTMYMDESNVRFIYHYDKPIIFKPDSSNPKAKFTLNLFTPFKFDRNVGMSVRVYYLSNNGQQNYATSDWYEVHEFNPIQDQNQKILDKLEMIQQQNIEIIMENQQLIKIGVLNACISQTAHDAISPYWYMGFDRKDTLEGCEKKVLEATK